jgi:hypothetical protein
MFYLLEVNHLTKPAPYRLRSMLGDPAYEPSKWRRGAWLGLPNEPVPMELWVYGGGGGDGLAELFLESIPVFRHDLLKALRDAGVDNLQTCPAILRDPSRGLERRDYDAVNILGAVACADMRRSTYTDVTGTGLIAVAFRRLVIDEAAAQDLLFFRLAQSLGSIIVHERVKRFLDPLPFKYLQWRALGAT